MSDDQAESLEPPPLPAVLLDPWPVISIGALAWLIATVVVFLIPSLSTWRPFTLAGLAMGALGTSIFLLQRSAARRGSRGAQTGLT